VNLPLDARPVIVAIAGPNGAGKTTFFETFIRSAGLRFLSADVIAGELNVSSYTAAAVADSLRQELAKQRESFVFETVFSDSVGAKLSLLKNAALEGYNVVLCFIGISGPSVSEQRVAMRISQGGHGVPTGKLRSRFPRTLANLRKALPELSHVWIFDNDDLRIPFRLVAVFENGQSVRICKPIPSWLRPLLPESNPGKK
jgi:predicted ABC-type ATPase